MSNGSARAAELLKERSERSESAIHNALERAADDRLAARLLTVCRGDIGLRDRILPYAPLLRRAELLGFEPQKDECAKLNAAAHRELGDPETVTRTAQYEMAFRMQASVPELTDFSGETRETLDLYGVKEPGDGSFASNCLLARRLAERGVRFIQLYHRDWDHHNDLVKFIRGNASSVDRATAALIGDLKQRGMLDETLIIWGGKDKLIPPDTAEMFHQDIPGSWVAMFDHLGHVPQEEAPAQTLTAVKQFLGIR